MIKRLPIFLILAMMQTTGDDSAWAAVGSTGPFSFVDPVVRLLPTLQDGFAKIKLQSSTPQAAVPGLTDVELPVPPAAKVTFTLVKDSTLPANTWLYQVEVSGLSPINTIQQRYAKVSYTG